MGIIREREKDDDDDDDVLGRNGREHLSLDVHMGLGNRFGGWREVLVQDSYACCLSSLYV